MMLVADYILNQEAQRYHSIAWMGLKRDARTVVFIYNSGS